MRDDKIFREKAITRHKCGGGYAVAEYFQSLLFRQPIIPFLEITQAAASKHKVYQFMEKAEGSCGWRVLAIHNNHGLFRFGKRATPHFPHINTCCLEHENSDNLDRPAPKVKTRASVAQGNLLFMEDPQGFSTPHADMLRIVNKFSRQWEKFRFFLNLRKQIKST